METLAKTFRLFERKKIVNFSLYAIRFQYSPCFKLVNAVSIKSMLFQFSHASKQVDMSGVPRETICFYEASFILNHMWN